MTEIVDPCNEKPPLRAAAEETVVVGVFAFLSGLIATGLEFPPPGEVLYATLIVAALAGVTAWARKRMIEVKA